MISTLALAALGSWTYAGFLAQPTPAPPSPPPASAPIRPIDVEPKKEPAAEPEPEPEPEPKAPPVSTATPPTRYRLADAGGQVWEHADPAYLRSFVEARNRSFVQQPDIPPLRARPSHCANGRCS